MGQEDSAVRAARKSAKHAVEQTGHELEHNRLPDPTARAIAALHEQLQGLAREVAEVRQRPVDIVLPAGLTRADIEEAFRSIREDTADPSATATEFREGGGI